MLYFTQLLALALVLVNQVGAAPGAVLSAQADPASSQDTSLVQVNEELKAQVTMLEAQVKELLGSPAAGEHVVTSTALLSCSQIPRL